MSFNKNQFLYEVINEKFIPVLGSDIFKIIVDFRISDQDEIYDGKILANIDDFISKKLREQFNLHDDVGDIYRLVYKLQILNNSESLKSYIRYVFNVLENTEVYLNHINQLIEIQKFPILLNATISNILSKAFVDSTLNYITQLNFSIPTNSLLDFTGYRHGQVLINIFGTTKSLDFSFGENEILDYLFLFANHDELNEILFDLFHDKHILILGITLPSWLIKVLVKLLLKFKSNRNQEIIIITRDAYYDNHIKEYLNFYCIKYYPLSTLGYTSIISFIADFSNQIKTLNTQVNFNIKYKESVFISYSRKDIEFVNKFKSVFKKKGVSIWYDIESLGVGDAYNKVIQEAISVKCKYFIPVISKNSINDPYSFVYHNEWLTALVLRRLNEKDSEKSFIKPIVIDETEFQDKRIPSEFRELHIERIAFADDIDTYINRFINDNSLTLV